MQLISFIFICMSLTTFVQVSRANTCKDNHDCPTDHCCITNYNPYIMSKRDVLYPEKWVNKNICRPYIADNASCKYPGFFSCGCRKTSKCLQTSKEDNLLSKLTKRKMAYRPGTWQCISMLKG
ncbi:hypothetical protein SNEBB_009709 [Seison nebaliae]|nr:hypothetical protein SNEBB_009709 [Seison nebaliae]